MQQSTGFSASKPQPQVQPAPADAGGADAFKTLLVGPGSGQMNLRAVKERALALRRSLEEFIDILHLHPERLTWEDSLERFGVMGVRHQQLQEQLRPVLRFYAAHPKAVNQSNADLLPVLLSTMRLPEAEAEERELLRVGGQQSGRAGNPQALEAAIRAFNALVDGVTQTSAADASAGVLSPKGALRQALAQELRAAVNRAADGSAKAAAAAPNPERDALLAAAACRQPK